MTQPLLVAAFSLVGVMARYSLGLAAERYLGGMHHLATLGINVFGSLLIGAIYVLGAELHIFGDDLRVALATGLLGGFTTFSAFSLETLLQIEQGDFAAAAVYVGLSIGGGLLAVAAGMNLTRMMLPS